jgi:hypothetical protein
MEGRSGEVHRTSTWTKLPFYSIPDRGSLSAIQDFLPLVTFRLVALGRARGEKFVTAAGPTWRQPGDFTAPGLEAHRATGRESEREKLLELRLRAATAMAVQQASHGSALLVDVRPVNTSY